MESYRVEYFYEGIVKERILYGNCLKLGAVEDSVNSFKVPNAELSTLDVIITDNDIVLEEELKKEPSAMYLVKSVEKVDPGVKYLVQRSKIFINNIDTYLGMTVKYRGNEIIYNLLENEYKIGPSKDINIVSSENTNFEIILKYDTFWTIDPGNAKLYRYVKNITTHENFTKIVNGFPLELRFGDSEITISINS